MDDGPRALAIWNASGPHPGQYDHASSDVSAPVPLWLSQLVDDPSLGLELVAGASGVDRRGPIRWAHIADTPDPTPWLEGGEVVLTTCIGVKDSDDLQRRLVANLTDRDVVAIGFGVGVIVDEVPPAMIAACNEHGMPLFTVPYEVPFLAVTRRVSHHTFEEHYATLRRAVQLHRQVLSAVISDDATPPWSHSTSAGWSWHATTRQRSPPTCAPTGCGDSCRPTGHAPRCSSMNEPSRSAASAWATRSRRWSSRSPGAR